jgi:hypothetical protein
MALGYGNWDRSRVTGLLSLPFAHIGPHLSAQAKLCVILADLDSQLVSPLS